MTGPGETAVPAQAVEAAAKKWVAAFLASPWRSLAESQRDVYRQRAADALAAAFPVLLAELRATEADLGVAVQVAAERADALELALAAEARLRQDLGNEGQRWAAKAEELYDALGVIMDICQHSNPIAQDADGFVSTGYTVSVGAIHRALAFLQGAGHNPPQQTVRTWAEFQAWLTESMRYKPAVGAATGTTAATCGCDLTADAPRNGCHCRYHGGNHWDCSPGCTSGGGCVVDARHVTTVGAATGTKGDTDADR